MKKLLACFLALLMVFGMLPASDLGLVSTVEAAGGTYVKVTSEPADWSGQYLIVYEDEKFMFNGALTTLDAVNNYQTVEITNNSITTTAEDYFTIAAVTDGYSIQSASGYFIGNTSDANALKSSPTTAYANTLSMNADGTVNIVSGGSYLRFNTNSGQDRFRYFKSGTYSSQKAICLYKLDSSGTVTETTAPATATPEVTPTPVVSTPTPAAGDSKTFTLITSSADMTAGDYLIVNTDSAYALNSTVTSSCMGRTAVTINGTQITTTDAAIIWSFQKNAEGNWTIYNAALGQYLVIDGTDTTSFKLSASADYAYVATDEGTDCIQLASTDAGGRFIYYNGASDTNGFRTYAVSNTSNIQLYRSGSTSSTTPAPSTATPTPGTVTPTPSATTPTPAPANPMSEGILLYLDDANTYYGTSGVEALEALLTSSSAESTLISLNDTQHTSTTSYNNLRDYALASADRPSDPRVQTGKYRMLYTQDWVTVDKGANGTSKGGINREHVIPQSVGGFNTSIGPGTDVHHVRPSWYETNNQRGNTAYGPAEGGTEEYATSGTYAFRYINDTAVEPADHVKGDIARILMYMHIAYSDDSAYTTELPNTDIFNGNLSTLVEWCMSDPVDVVEINRNNYGQYRQGNRNPFIDAPALAEVIFGSGAYTDTAWHTVTNEVGYYQQSYNNGVPAYAASATSTYGGNLYIADSVIFDTYAAVNANAVPTVVSNGSSFCFTYQIVAGALPGDVIVKYTDSGALLPTSGSGAYYTWDAATATIAVYGVDQDITITYASELTNTAAPSATPTPTPAPAVTPTPTPIPEGTGRTFALVTDPDDISDGSFVIVAVNQYGKATITNAFAALTRELNSASWVTATNADGFMGSDVNSVPSTITVGNELLIWKLTGDTSGFTLTAEDDSGVLRNSSNNLYYDDGTASIYTLRTSSTSLANAFNILSGETRALDWRLILTNGASYDRFRFSTASNQPTSGYSNNLYFYKEVATDSRSITFKDADGTILSSQMIPVGGNAVAPNVTAPLNHAFLYWTDGVNTYSDAEVNALSITESMILTAVYIRTHVTVSFSATTGGSLSSVASVKKQLNSVLTSAELPNATANSNYSFGGWTVNGTSVEPLSFVLTEDVTFVANFNLNSFTVAFKDKDGEVLSEQTVNYGSYISVPTAPVVEGSTFLGWSDGLTLYSSAELSVLLLSEGKTFTAVYQATNYKVQFVAQEGGSLSGVTVYNSIPYGNTFASANIAFPTAVADAGYTFGGWLLNGTTYASGDDAGDVSIDSDLTVTAQFLKNNVTVTFMDADGSVLSSTTVASGGTVPAPALQPPAGHTFTGWTDGTNVYTNDAVSAMQHLADVILTAVYTPESYTVTFLSGDSVVNTQSVPYGQSAAKPVDPVVEGETFIGWTVNDAIVDVTKYPITQDTTFVAQYSDILVRPYVSAEGSLGLPDSIGYTVTDSAQTVTRYMLADSFVSGNTYIVTGYFNGEYYAVSNDEYAADAGMSPIAVVLNGNSINGYYITVDDGIDAADLEWMAASITTSGYTDYFALYDAEASSDAYLGVGNWLNIENSLTTSSIWKYDADSLRLMNYANPSYYLCMNTANGNRFDFYSSSANNTMTSVHLWKKVEVPLSQDYYVSLVNSNGTVISQNGYIQTNATSSTTVQLSAVLSSDFGGSTDLIFTSSNDAVATIDASGKISFTGQEGIVKFMVQAPFVVDGVTYYATDYVLYTVSKTSEAYPLEDTSDKFNFPEFPDDGAVRIHKDVSDATIFDNTGVAEIELSVAGIPYNDPVDVVLVIDVSNTMSADAGDGLSRLDASKASAIQFVETLVQNSDGSFNENRISVVTFGTAGEIVQSMTLVEDTDTLDSIYAKINAIELGGATNYDAGLAAANMVLTGAAADELGADRQQYILFMTDGAPNCYNHVAAVSDTSNFAFTTPDNASIIDLRTYMVNTYGASYWKLPSASTWSGLTTSGQYYAPFLTQYWPLWVSGAVSNSTIHISTSASASGQLMSLSSALGNYHHTDNIYAALSKGELSRTEISSMGFGAGTSLLDAEIYTIGFGLSNGSNVVSIGDYRTDFTAAQCTEVLERISSGAGYALNADNAEELSEAYSDIAESILFAATDATVTDVMGEDYDLQFASVVHNEQGAPIDIGMQPTIEVGFWTLDATTRERVSYTLMEQFSFSTDDNGNLTAVTSSLLGSCYNASENAFVGKFLSYDFDTETFKYTLDIDGEKEMTLRYWVYLTGSMEGSRSAGVYDTNEYAKLRYTNWIGNPCSMTFPVPSLPWGAALVRYSYYLVNEDGQPINSNGTVIPFAEHIQVGETQAQSFALNSTTSIYGASNIPTGYALYNSGAYFTVMASNGGSTGTAYINDTTETTYLVTPLTTNLSGTNLELTSYAVTHIYFAVKTSDSSDLSFNAVGAQAHMIHKTEDLSTAALYTDGIRFGVEVQMDDLKKSLNVGEYFAFGLMMQPSHKLAGISSNVAFDVEKNRDAVSRFTPSIDRNGDIYVGNGSLVFNTKTDKVKATGYKVNGRSHYVLNTANMIQWTDAMENAPDTSTLVGYLRAEGATIFGLNEDGTGFRYVTYLMFAKDETQRTVQANTEITYAGIFVKLNTKGEYDINTTFQKTNCSQRIFTHYNYTNYGVGSGSSLNGWSVYAPLEETQIGWLTGN